MFTPNITRAVQLLRQGKLVAFPTETVYGLGADANNESALRKIFQAKERPYDHPLIVHIAEIQQLSAWAMDISQDAMKLARTFWPGPLTLLLKKQPHVLDLVTGGQATIGVRIPRHSVAQALLQAFGSALAAPSANRFTHISPTTVEAVCEELGDRIDMILDGGACAIGLESTIVDMSTETPRILRPGVIHAQMLSQVLGSPVLFSPHNIPLSPVPGQHELHYAPQTKTVLVEANNIFQIVKTDNLGNQSIAVMIHSDIVLPVTNSLHIVKMPQDAMQYAHDLYHTLRSLDHGHFKQIMIESVPSDLAWEAIRDRLTKASGIRGILKVKGS